MYTVYFIVSNKTSFYYVGMTSKSLHTRLIQHKSAARLGKKSPLYDCMRKHGLNNFLIVFRDHFENKVDCQVSERYWIALARQEEHKILNLADGGEGGYVVPEASKEVWRAKLSIARQGRKPALGMKHTEENKKFFSKCNERKILKYPEEITNLSFKQAKEQYQISKTHYYRLLKRAKSNVLS